MSFSYVLKFTFKSRICHKVFCHGIAKLEIVKLWIPIGVLLALFRVKFVVILFVFLSIVVSFYVLGLGLKLMKNYKIIGTQDWLVSGLWLVTPASFHVRNFESWLELENSRVGLSECDSRVPLDSSYSRTPIVTFFFLLYIYTSLSPKF